MKGAQKLTPMDASFLHLETRNTHMHIGGVAIFEPSPIGSGEALYEAIVRVIEPRLDVMPRYRQRVAFLPLSLDTPVWIDDPEFNISSHVLRAALPAPGGDRQLQHFISRRSARQTASNPTRLAKALRDTASGLATVAQTIRAPRSVINGPTGTSRAYVFTRFPLDDFKLVKQVFGGTINDVVLAAVAGGVRHYLAAHDVDPNDEENALQALCPVSIRDDSERAALGNRLALLLVKLPIDEANSEARLARVRATVDRLKARKQAVGADFLLNLAGFAPSTLHAMVARASLRQIGFNLVVTNVPGPQFPLYFCGARLVEAFPVAFLYEGQRLAIAIFSYMGWLNFGYLSDARGVPDVDLFAKCVDKGFKELVRAAKRRQGFDQQVSTPRRPTSRSRPHRKAPARR